MNLRKLSVIAAVVVTAAAVFAFRLVLLAVGSILYLYLLPGLVARDRAHPHQRKLQHICALSGWLILPWLIGFCIALNGPVKTPLFGKPALASDLRD